MAASRYAAAFALLNRLQPTLALDLHLAPVLSDLTRLIRRRALQQHVRCYFFRISVLCLTKLAGLMHAYVVCFALHER
jgi:hypothetical protein